MIGLVLLSLKLEQLRILKVLPSTIDLWYDLPLHIRSLPTLSSFTNAIKHLFYRNPRNFLTMGIVVSILFTVNYETVPVI